MHDSLLLKELSVEKPWSGRIKYKAIVSVGSPLQLIFSIDAISCLGISPSESKVLYFLKNESQSERNRDGLDLANSVGFGQVVKVRRKFLLPKCRLRGLQNWARLSVRYMRKITDRAVRNTFWLDEIFGNGAESVTCLVGHGAWMPYLEELYKPDFSCLVDAGMSSLDGRLFNLKSLGGHKKEFRPSLYFSIYPRELIGVPPELYAKNEMSYFNRLSSKNAKRLQGGLFISTSSGRDTRREWYSICLQDALERCSGNLFYYPRRDEPFEDIKFLEKNYNIKALTSNRSIELYLHNNGIIPEGIYAAGSTAIYTLAGIYKDIPAVCYENPNFTPTVNHRMSELIEQLPNGYFKALGST